MLKSVFKTSHFWLFGTILLALLLRLPYLDQFPPSLYSDEVSQGYNAYSLLKTGKDEYGTSFPVSIRSFGDWKPPLQTYLMIPTIALFGLNEWGVRLPSVVLGAGTILLMYLLVTTSIDSFKMDNRSRMLKWKTKIALLTSLLLAISPWHILQSRSGLHGAITLFFITLGFWSLFRGFKDFKYWWIGAVSFPLAIYGYHGVHLTLLLSFVLFIIFFHKHALSHSKQILPMFGLSLLILLPLIIGFIKNPEILTGRARFVNVFYDKGVDLTIWDAITSDGSSMSPLVARFFHNKPFYYMSDITRRMFQHISGEFLFLKGDGHLPFQIPDMGILYFFEIATLCIGLWFLAKENRRLLLFMGGLWFIFLVPSSLTFLTPAANRSFYALIPITFISGVGLTYVMLFSKTNLLKIPILIFFGANVAFFSWQFFVNMPLHYSQWWLHGYKQVFDYVEQSTHKNKRVLFTGQASMPYIYYLFTQKIDPEYAIFNLHRNETKDEVGFEHVSGIDRYTFVRKKDWEVKNYTVSTPSLLVVLGDEELEGNEIKQVLYPDGQIAFRIYEL